MLPAYGASCRLLPCYYCFLPLLPLSRAPSLSSCYISLSCSLPYLSAYLRKDMNGDILAVLLPGSISQVRLPSLPVSQICLLPPLLRQNCLHVRALFVFLRDDRCLLLPVARGAFCCAIPMHAIGRNRDCIKRDFVRRKEHFAYAACGLLLPSPAWLSTCLPHAWLEGCLPATHLLPTTYLHLRHRYGCAARRDQRTGGAHSLPPFSTCMAGRDAAPCPHHWLSYCCRKGGRTPSLAHTFLIMLFYSGRPRARWHR